MARIKYLTTEDLKEEDQELIPVDRPQRLFQGMAHSTRGLRAFTRYVRALHGTKLESRLKELVILQVAVTANVPYFFAHHVNNFRAGLTADDPRMIVSDERGERTNFTELERAVLQATRDMTQGNDSSDETFAVLERDLPADQLIELLLWIGAYQMATRVVTVLHIDLEETFIDGLAKFPSKG